MYLQPLLAALVALPAALAAIPIPDNLSGYASTLITRDVLVIGGGSSGTYTAIRLKSMGKTVAVVEKEATLGGHTNTFTDSVTGKTFDYGVIEFEDTPVVHAYAASLNISLVPLVLGTGASYTADMRTGASNKLPQGDIATAITAYATQLAQYPFLSNGFNLPNPVPSDLLLPWGSFVQKYSLNAFAYTAFVYMQGVGNMLALPTLYVMKYFSPAVLSAIATNGFLTTADSNNQRIYTNAARVLGPDAILHSKVTTIIRNELGVLAAVSTPTGTKLITAKKLVIAIPPKVANLGFADLDSVESNLFSQFGNGYYWDAVVRNSGIPDNATISNADPAAPYGIPNLPSVYVVQSTGVPNLHSVYYGSTTAMSDDAVKTAMLTAVGKLAKALNGTSTGNAQLVGFNNHSPYELRVSSDAIQGGFYNRLEALQGRRKTWWVGAAWQAHDSSAIWQNVEDSVLPALM
ncbi:putative FAD dependent oxidoreductase [Trichodelitschia bisporula]|uniref:Putative FAD dependent oxidoreductase n=1 Tax=Trichodelitschia bisporula TaxID=703511 RepID=A0A6G1HKS6_9PEZI|nr:putative FAD dependent oxidoreductase [Trichodelitschia bisporula]